MRQQMIFDTQGTGFDKKHVRQMMEPSKVPFVEGLGDGGLGDEIMLLDGLDDTPFPHGWSDGPARNFTLPSQDPTTDYNFDPEVDLSGGLSASRLGAPVARSGWPAVKDPERFRYSGLGRADYRYTGLGRADYRYTGLGRADYRYTGLGAQGGGWPQMQKDPRFKYTGLDGFGTVDGDRAIATQIATAALNLCNGLCAAASGASAQASCRTGCQTAYDTAMIAVTAAYPPGAGTPAGPPAPTASERAAIQAKLDRIAGTASSYGGAAPPSPAASGIDTNTLLIGGLVVAGLIGVYLVTK
jgi:hypothetical protein